MIDLYLRTLSHTIRLTPWLVPFLVLGSLGTCAVPFVFAFYPLSTAIEYLWLFLAFTLILLGVTLATWYAVIVERR